MPNLIPDLAAQLGTALLVAFQQHVSGGFPSGNGD